MSTGRAVLDFHDSLLGLALRLGFAVGIRRMPWMCTSERENDITVEQGFGPCKHLVLVIPLISQCAERQALR